MRRVSEANCELIKHTGSEQLIDEYEGDAARVETTSGDIRYAGKPEFAG